MDPVIEVIQVVRIPLQVMRAAPWWVDAIVVFAAVGAGMWVVSVIAAAIMSILLVLGVIAALAIALALGWWTHGKRAYRWQRIGDTGWMVSRDPAVVGREACMHVLHGARRAGEIGYIAVRGPNLVELIFCRACYVIFLGDGCTLPNTRALPRGTR